MDGILNIYKTAGMTSHDVVSKVRKILKTKKVGHTGTLDPDAVGVLPICVGKATKVVELLTNFDKTYKCIMKLGVTTTTEDASGEVISELPVEVTPIQVTEAIKGFIGEYNQIPPMYSALKVNGRKLYEYAREGITIERKARKVFIQYIEEIEFLENDEVSFVVHCSKGTYIRTLCVDIGEKLGCGAHMKSLERLAVGIFHEKDAVTLEQLSQIDESLELSKYITKIEDIFSNLSKVFCKREADKILYNGNTLLSKNINKNFDIQLGNEYLVYDYQGKFIGIYLAKLEDEVTVLKPVKLFL